MSEELPINFDVPTERHHCNCGCADEDAANVGGWCMWCDHGYRLSALEPKKRWSYHYTDDADGRGEDVHFANYCTGAPDELKESAIRRLSENSFGR
jgi:hypothetical protein